MYVLSVYLLLRLYCGPFCLIFKCGMFSFLFSTSSLYTLHHSPSNHQINFGTCKIIMQSWRTCCNNGRVMQGGHMMWLQYSRLQLEMLTFSFSRRKKQPATLPNLNHSTTHPIIEFLKWWLLNFQFYCTSAGSKLL